MKDHQFSPVCVGRRCKRNRVSFTSKKKKVEGPQMTAIYVALVIYMVVLFGVGLFYSKKNATINDFLLAGRDLGVVAATLTVTCLL